MSPQSTETPRRKDDSHPVPASNFSAAWASGFFFNMSIFAAASADTRACCSGSGMFSF
jgi:hypothetical protein